ncbi:uncharacterized protein GGS22DRAFT_162244 [Annulohypoxylon maeteangense]|uniref:uncharacterized protein n=1 Tax=Annulohypoxylon maeteangense TaxID=1927788 RepID=UPI002007B8A0|nr:uncharacterized protein GGS22DRAFT_162244 [Annulohypoxylon maeteangense]KAI0885897.1 hypothetical protein GGS22DRAFT_162244 [Annulohypoxylon maeteangense]
MKCTSYITLGALFAAITVVAQDFSGSGQIFILNSTSLGGATPADRVGCLDSTGAVTLDNCATFTKLSSYPLTISSEVGNCTFADSSQPANTDNVYGANSYAWHCLDDYAATTSDQLYTVKGFTYPFLCHGDIDCYYDIKLIPSSDATAPVWSYVWGSRQTSVPAGHTKVMWYWNKTS